MSTPSGHHSNFQGRVYVCPEHDVHHESLQDAQKLARHVDCCLLVRACFDFLKPDILSLQNIVFKLIQQNDELVFVECMSNSFSLALPAMVCFREQKRISEEVLENSFKSSCFVNLCILGDYDVFHDLVVR